MALGAFHDGNLATDVESFLVLAPISPAFPKLYVMTLGFYERPTLVTVFSNQKKSAEGFRFCENKAKKKRKEMKTFSICFAGSHYRDCVHPK